MSEKKYKLYKALFLAFILIHIALAFWALSLGMILLMFYCAFVALLLFGAYQGSNEKEKR